MGRLSGIKERILAHKRTALLGLVGVVAVWFLFLDSHSLLTRVQLHREEARLEAYNEALKAEIAALEDKLSRPLSDEEVERISREDFGMQRSDETVYPVIRP